MTRSEQLLSPYIGLGSSLDYGADLLYPEITRRQVQPGLLGTTDLYSSRRLRQLGGQPLGLGAGLYGGLDNGIYSQRDNLLLQ